MILNTTRILVYSSLTYHVIMNGIQDSLHINLTYEPSDGYQQVAWRHNQLAIDSITNPRVDIAVDGGLTICEVQPSDAGNYTVIACNRRGCDSVVISVHVECELCFCYSKLLGNSKWEDFLCPFKLVKTAKTCCNFLNSR